MCFDLIAFGLVRKCIELEIQSQRSVKTTQNRQEVQISMNFIWASVHSDGLKIIVSTCVETLSVSLSLSLSTTYVGTRPLFVLSCEHIRGYRCSCCVVSTYMGTLPLFVLSCEYMRGDTTAVRVVL